MAVFIVVSGVSPGLVFGGDQNSIGSSASPARRLHLTQSALSHAIRKLEDRLDIFNQFLLPANCSPARHKTIETTDIILQMVAAGRGVAAFPDWLVREYGDRLPPVPLRIGESGIFKQIHLGIREDDDTLDFIFSLGWIPTRQHSASREASENRMA